MNKDIWKVNALDDKDNILLSRIFKINSKNNNYISKIIEKQKEDIKVGCPNYSTVEAYLLIPKEVANIPVWVISKKTKKLIKTELYKLIITYNINCCYCKNYTEALAKIRSSGIEVYTSEFQHQMNLKPTLWVK